ncbi:methyltransferase domain-containing protein [Streptomyces sp. JJ66]|uniref:methyltransferase domain-containing protein n=1 Tax=Streptomyces sp. JJ66 TaxID=2803843 RepID=UPI00214CA3E7|nr:methyltransferase domain-containing protein [Streptomyces sp. JJ66]
MLESARNVMTERLIREGALRSPHWKSAFLDVSRETFVPRFTIGYGSASRVFENTDADYSEAVYADTSLVTEWDAAGTPVSSSSAPSLMARMLDAFAVDEGPVLEVGTGTGYNCALLCHHFGDSHVVSVDVDPALARAARDKLRKHGYTPAIITGDGTRGWSHQAPYRGILATCGVDRIPPAWLGQVTPGGLIVTNIGTGIAQLTVNEGGGAEGGFLSEAASFMRARPAPGYVAETAPRYSKTIINGAGRKRTYDLPGQDEGEGFLGDLILAESLEISMVQHDVLAMSLLVSEEETVHGLVQPASGSWARVTSLGGTAVHVVSSGPRDLWADRLRLFTEWVDAWRPQPGAYRLRVTPEGDHTLMRGAQAWHLPN